MIETARLKIPAYLSDDATKCELCLNRFSEFGTTIAGVSGLHLNLRRGTAIVHYDASVTSLDRVESAMRVEGKRLDSTYRHMIVPVQGMDCTDCALTIERSVSRMRGVQTASVNFASAKLAFEYDRQTTNPQAIAKRVSDLGYKVSTDEQSAVPAERSGFLGHLLARENRVILVAAILAIIGGAWSLASLPESAIAVPLLSGLAMLVAGLPVARKGVISLITTRRLDINMLMAIALIGAAALGEWLEGATLVVLFSAGEALEGYTMDRARKSIQSLMKLAPAFALVRHGDHEHRVPVEQVAVGDVIMVRPGDRIPVDGKVVEGNSTLDQSPVTGESIPVSASAGTVVYSGSINGSGMLDVRVERPADDSTIARIIKLVQEAQAQKAPTQRFIDRFATYYTPAVVALAIVVALAPPLLFNAGWSDWIGRALVLLVIACPCALVISTPVSIVSALSAAARSGVLIKGGAALEAAGSLQAIAFDKTGTLTSGRLSVVAVEPVDPRYRTDEILRLASAVERYVDHPIARAIVAESDSRQLDSVPSDRIHNVRNLPGMGIEAEVDGLSVRLGSIVAFKDSAPAQSEKLDLVQQQIAASGSTPIVLIVEGTVAGVIGLADQLRPNAREALTSIRQSGVKRVIMLTGDREQVAQPIGAAAGVDSIVAEVLPAQKDATVQRLLDRFGRVGMVGDGVNDAPALARATVGIAMGAAGTDVALETADVALMSDNLSRVGYAIRLSRAAKRTISQNIGIALGLKLIFLVLAIGGVATLWEAVFADVGASIIVIFNGMRLLGWTSRD